jgi:hypothetical protein
MAEYVLTPESKLQPAGTRLMEELHRRGFPVEINLTGQDQGWAAIRFYEAGPPEVECFLAYEPETGRYKISVSPEASLPTYELQLLLVDSLLQILGGYVDNATTSERFTPGQFTAKLKSLRNPPGKLKDLVWILFAWAVAALGLFALLFAPALARSLVMVVLLFSTLSASGLTYFHFKNK